ncbi:hypothetical protein RMN57_29370 [Kitasatospora sp. CM 4170]|uniref:Uncharacterized protein n=1 Tax=Kitasatospora aburaviensis TaxID=67265 RepID=A0ABW1ENZ1_9ACTN|nr:hypothetical protein [Kitasatospora sp. CM 4170]WNM48503.1 hypothetical protein RMN57_29370 [Kitasatospora sp. CM 4170]
MARWALVVQETEGVGNDRIWGTNVLAEVEGTREDALAELKRIVPTYTPQHPFNSRQRTLLRDGDTYLLISKGSVRDYHCVFKVWELLWDSKRPEIQQERLADGAAG